MNEITVNQAIDQSTQALLTSEIVSPSADNAAILVEFEREIRGTYPPSTSHPYHNWSHHIPEVLNAALMIGEHLTSCGGTFNREVVIAAVLGHDAGYGYDHKALGFSSKEALAADISEKKLLELGADAAFCARVAHTIRATESAVEPVSTEERIVRAADLRGLAGSVESFKQNSKLLHQEFQNARGKQIDFQEFFHWQTSNVLSKYLALMIQLTPNASDADDRSTWHQSAVRNITKTAWGTPTIGLIDPQELPRQFFEQRELVGNEIVLSNAPAASLKEKLTELNAWKNRNNAAVLIVPGNGEALSLPDKCCSELHLTFNNSLGNIREAIRVAEDNARMYVYFPADKQMSEQFVIEAINQVVGINSLFHKHNMDGYKVLCFEVNRVFIC